jgi:hypothetical protein
MVENLPEEPATEEQEAEKLEKELLDAMRNLRRKNKNIEEYLDNLARAGEKPAEEAEKPPEGKDES